MAKVKVEQSPARANINESGGPTRRTRHLAQRQVEQAEMPECDFEDQEERVTAHSSEAESRTKSQKVIVQQALPTTASSPVSILQPERRNKRRGGGNKRKFDHEYCLTCENYGRACGGKRSGIEGCAVCRDPDREKGEKLRECLWRDEEAGVFTYHAAREAHKQAQAEKRSLKGKAPTVRRQTMAFDRTTSEASTHTKNMLTAPDPLGLVANPGAHPSLPLPLPLPLPLTKPLDVRPPNSGIGAALTSATNDRFSKLSSAAAQHDPNTVNVNISRHAEHISQHEGPRIHRPQIISLAGFGAEVEYTTNPTLMGQAAAGPVPFTRQLAVAPAPLSYAPYYNPSINAYILPAYPHSNLLPPHAHVHSNTQPYISPYDAHPSIPVAMSGSHPPRLVSFQNNLPPSDTTFSAAKTFHSKPRPLDKSGVPCRKWSKCESEVATLSGHGFSMKGWKPTASGQKDTNEYDDMDNTATATSDKAGIQDSKSSPLSSAIDMDEEMYDFSGEAVDFADDSEDGATNEDRLQAQVNTMFDTNTKRRHSLVLDSVAARTMDIDESYDNVVHEDLTSDEDESRTIRIKS